MRKTGAVRAARIYSRVIEVTPRETAHPVFGVTSSSGQGRGRKLSSQAIEQLMQVLWHMLVLLCHATYITDTTRGF